MATAVVSGSASGIGAAVRARLEADGFSVIGVDIRDAEVTADLSAAAGREQAVAGALDACGGTLDRVVVCAGLGAHVEPIANIATVNYFGAVDLLDGLLPVLGNGTAPAAVAVCSNSAQMAPLDDHPLVKALLDHDEAAARAALDNGGDGFIAYAGSKMALGRAVRRRARTWGDAGVRLNAIAPGPVETPLLQGGREHPLYGEAIKSISPPLARLATPAEIAEFIVLMLGPQAAYMHGSVVYVDGGHDAELRPERF
jgi:NAD(P)-dependent dehydrogenase (short-subunit alcohol dehydrogenase family)